MDKLGIKERGGSSLIETGQELEDFLQKLYNIIEHDCEENMGDREALVRTSDDEEDVTDNTTFCDKNFKPIIVPGGSCANTVKGIASFGEKCGFIGKISVDSAGQFYKQSMSERGVYPLMTETFGKTGQVLCLITPDGQRTMRAFLGASSEMSVSDLLPLDFVGVELVHIEGYSIYNESFTVKAMQLAKQNRAMISFDMGSFEVVRQFRSKILELVRDYVDIVFCNLEEARMLMNGGTAEECVDYLSSLCRVAIVMIGKDGCWVRSGSEKYRCPTKPIENPIDTTGAGDLFASGFLYGYLQGYSLEQCARLGALSGAEVVQVMGAEISPDRYLRIKQDVNSAKLMANAKSSAIHPGDKFGSSPKTGRLVVKDSP